MLYTVQTCRAICANSVSCDNETLLLVAAIYTPILSFWEGPFENSVPLSNFATHSNQIISSFLESTFSGHEGKHPVVLAT